MKAVTWNELGAQPALRDDLPEPAPGADEVLVRVHASSVNPVDTQGKLALRVAVAETPQ